MRFLSNFVPQWIQKLLVFSIYHSLRVTTIFLHLRKMESKRVYIYLSDLHFIFQGSSSLSFFHQTKCQTADHWIKWRITDLRIIQKYSCKSNPSSCRLGKKK